jgi:hypothetical protein
MRHRRGRFLHLLSKRGKDLLAGRQGPRRRAFWKWGPPVWGDSQRASPHFQKALLWRTYLAVIHKRKTLGQQGCNLKESIWDGRRCIFFWNAPPFIWNVLPYHKHPRADKLWHFRSPASTLKKLWRTLQWILGIRSLPLLKSRLS